jgi:hypothetical protein
MSGWLSGLVVVALVAALAPFAYRRMRAAMERAYIKRTFAKYVSPKVVGELIREPHKSALGSQRRRISFIVFQLRDDDVENVQRQLERALPIMREGGGIFDMASSLVMVIFGIPQREENVDFEANRALVASRLMSELGPEIRLVYGSVSGLAGTFGIDTWLHYGAVLPNFGAILERLVKLEFGQSGEISPAA